MEEGFQALLARLDQRLEALITETEAETPALSSREMEATNGREVPRLTPESRWPRRSGWEGFVKRGTTRAVRSLRLPLKPIPTPADGDSQTLMFQKMNELGQGMKDIATLLGTVIKLWNSKPSRPHKIATRDELLRVAAGVVDTAGRASSRGRPLCTHRSHPGVHSSAEGQHHDAHPTPIWQYMAQGHHWFQSHQLEAWGGLAALFVAGLVCKTPAPEAPGPRRMAPVVRARGTEVQAVEPGVVVGVMNGDVWMDDRETHDLLLAPCRQLGRNTFHIHPTLLGWTQEHINLVANMAR